MEGKRKGGERRETNGNGTLTGEKRRERRTGKLPY